MKNIEKFKKPILIISGAILVCIGYYIYYKNSNTYKEFEETSNLDELLPYEEEYQKIEENNNDEKEINNNIEEAKMIMVHITGEVKHWGVLELEEGSRVIDAVNKAGGFTDSADEKKVNLAYTLSDGVKIYIPSKNEEKVEDFTSGEYICNDARG